MVTIHFDPLPVYFAVAGGIFTVGFLWGWMTRIWVMEERLMKTREEQVKAGKHMCHWPTCKTAVPPKLWGCKVHWFKLPKILRDQIWATYRPGQEADKNPSPEYLDAAYTVQRWIDLEIKEGRAS
jgi:hypothetical protein